MLNLIETLTLFFAGVLVCVCGYYSESLEITLWFYLVALIVVWIFLSEIKLQKYVED